jgi:hypothetical protein
MAEHKDTVDTRQGTRGKADSRMEQRPPPPPPRGAPRPRQPKRSMNNAAGPVAAVRLPSRTATSKTRLSPSSLAVFRVTTASLTLAPPPSTETVALGGSWAKLPVPVHSPTRSAVGRSDGPVCEDNGIRRHAPEGQLIASSFAPCALMTARAGMAPAWEGWPMVLASGTWPLRRLSGAGVRSQQRRWSRR